MCSICKDPIEQMHDTVILAKCSHKMHVACYESMCTLRRKVCCSQVTVEYAQAQAQGGYSIDSGTNAVERGKITEHLEYCFEKVGEGTYHKMCMYIERIRNKILTKKNIIIGGDGEAISVNFSNPYAPKKSVYKKIPNKPGGIVPAPLTSHLQNIVQTIHKGVVRKPQQELQRATTLAPCTRKDCGGPSYCVHRFIKEIDVAIVCDWRLYDLPFPLLPEECNVVYAQNMIGSIIRYGASPADLYRCGAVPESLALCGVTLFDLVIVCKYNFKDVIAGLQLTWDRLMVLYFHPALLVMKRAFPLVLCIKLGLDAWKLCQFNVTYIDIIDTLKFSVYDLVALGFTGITLAQIGMTGTNLCQLVQKRDSRRNLQWFTRAFMLSPAFIRKLCSSSSSNNNSLVQQLIIAAT